MTTRTLTALFDSAAGAEHARQQLSEIGLAESEVRIVDRQSDGTATELEGGKGMWESIKDFFSGEDSDAYAEGLRRGGYLLTARVDEPYAQQAISILEGSDAVDLDERVEQWRAEGWNASPSERQSESEEAIPLAEERLRVGKREVERGTVRVRSYIVEEPAHAEVKLRDERVDVERRPVRSQTDSADPNLMRERTIEMSETSEEAVVGKDAVVDEEVVVRKMTGERTEGIDETVRRTEVDVEDSRDPDQTPIPPGSGKKSARKSEQRRRPS